MTIKINDLIPLLKHGWVVMDPTGDWYWYERKPQITEFYSEKEFWDENCFYANLSITFNIERVEDWKKSLIEVGGK